MYKRTTVLLLAISIVSICSGNPRSKKEIKQIALSFLSTHSGRGSSKAPAKITTVDELYSSPSVSIMGNGNKFVVVSADDNTPAILGYSDRGYTGENTNFRWWLNAMEQVVSTQANGAEEVTPDKPSGDYPASVEPMVTTRWGQGTPYNLLCPTTTGQFGVVSYCLTGCVATAMAQILAYHKAPIHGHGTRTIYYPTGNVYGTPVTADFGGTTYQYDQMLDSYSGSYTPEAAQAVAQLMQACGVASNMMYGVNGSGAYTTDAAAGLREYFGMSNARALVREKFTKQVWMDLVYSEIAKRQPILYGGSDASMGGHAFVLDGYNEDGLVHVNWGWEGDEDGYYNIALLNPGSYQFSLYQDMIIGIEGVVSNPLTADVTVTTPGSLMDQLDATKLTAYKDITVHGAINSDDLRKLRYMAGRDSIGNGTAGILSTLDLSDATVVEGGAPYLYEGKVKYATTDNELPYKAFYDCEALTVLKLPKNIRTISAGALAMLPSLEEFELVPAEGADYVREGNMILSTDKTRLLALVPTERDEFTLPSTVTTIGDYALSGCSRLSKVTVPASVTTIGDEAFSYCYNLREIKVANKKAPALGNNVFDQVQMYLCTLRVPAGSKSNYTRALQWRDFAGSINGVRFDNIKEFGTQIRINNAIREYGDENPTFTYKVVGEVPDGRPEFSCAATATSGVGRYTITATRGTLTSEELEIVDGTLIVRAAPLTVKAGHYTKAQGEDNPVFKVTYEGFKNQETEAVLTTRPTITTEAAKDSPVGIYTLVVSGGEAANYELTYENGTLEVVEPTAISEIADSERGTAFDVYTVTGVCVATGVRSLAGLPAGLYIVNGVKVIKK